MTTFAVVDTACPAIDQADFYVAHRHVGGESLVRRVVRRVSDAEGLDGVAVIATTATKDLLCEMIPSDDANRRDRRVESDRPTPCCNK